MTLLKKSSDHLSLTDRDGQPVHQADTVADDGSRHWQTETLPLALLSALESIEISECRFELLDKAKKANQHVPDIVLGKKDLPQAQPPYYSPGQESEAIVYAQIFLPGWKNTPGALTWLRQSEESTHEHLLGPRRPGLLEMPGVTPAQVGSFFEAAAGFYRQAPWKIVGDDSTLKVECARYQSGPWYAVIMGQAGRTLGLALYEDLRIVRLMQQGRMTDEEHSRQVAVLVLTFGEQTELTVKDLEASQQHRWQVAGPEAYPDIFKKERGASLRPPLAWELELMEGCLRAIPEFVKRRKPADSTIEELILTVVGGELKLVLTWEG